MVQSDYSNDFIPFLGHCDFISLFYDFALYLQDTVMFSTVFKLVKISSTPWKIKSSMTKWNVTAEI